MSFPGKWLYKTFFWKHPENAGTWSAWKSVHVIWCNDIYELLWTADLLPSVVRFNILCTYQRLAPQEWWLSFVAHRGQVLLCSGPWDITTSVAQSFESMMGIYLYVDSHIYYVMALVFCSGVMLDLISGMSGKPVVSAWLRTMIWCWIGRMFGMERIKHSSLEACKRTTTWSLMFSTVWEENIFDLHVSCMIHAEAYTIERCQRIEECLFFPSIFQSACAWDFLQRKANSQLYSDVDVEWVQVDIFHTRQCCCSYPGFSLGDFSIFPNGKLHIL